MMLTAIVVIVGGDTTHLYNKTMRQKGLQKGCGNTRVCWKFEDANGKKSLFNGGWRLMVMNPMGSNP